MNLSDEQIEALKKSIEHWEENVKAQTPEKASVDADKCALCVKYQIELPSHLKCMQCPIYLSTGNLYCVDTPYEQADEAYDDWKYYHAGSDDDSHENAKKYKNMFKKYACEELAFLKSLLEEDEKLIDEY